MPELEKLPIAQRVLITITQEKDQKRLESVLESLHIPLIFQARGQGTAPSEMMDIFGLGGDDPADHRRFSPQASHPARI